jgi:hypothetical protein
MRIGIVGPEAAKLTPNGENFIRATIRKILSEALMNGPVTLVSGHSPLKGVDWLAEDEAKPMGCYDPNYIFTPKQNQWKYVEYGFRSRNIDIAVASEQMYVFVVNEFAPTYTPKKFDGYCYHCKTYAHFKSGGCWTGKCFEKIYGKKANWVVIDQRSSS